MLAAASLEEGEAWDEESFGVSPAYYGGEHLGLGTRYTSLLVGEVYREGIVADPRRDLSDALGEKLSSLLRPSLVTRAVHSNLKKIFTTLLTDSIESIGSKRTGRKTSESGSLIRGPLFCVAGACFPQMPYFIGWLD